MRDCRLAASECPGPDTGQAAGQVTGHEADTLVRDHFGASAHAHASQLRRPRPGYRFGLRARVRARKLTLTFTQEDLMASRRPTEPPKEIPKVIKPDEKAAATS